MDQDRSCFSTVLNGTLLVNTSIPSHLMKLTCQNSSTSLTNSTVKLNFSSSIPLIDGAAKYICYVFYGLILPIGVFGNSVVVYVVGFRKKKRNSGDIYTLSLACADFLATLVAPMIVINDLITDMSVWFYGEILCHVMHAITLATLCASAWSLAFISIDRLQWVTFFYLQSSIMLDNHCRRFTYI